MPLADAPECQRLEEGLEKPCPVILRYEDGAILRPNDLCCVGESRLVDHTSESV